MRLFFLFALISANSMYIQAQSLNKMAIKAERYFDISCIYEHNYDLEEINLDSLGLSQEEQNFILKEHESEEAELDIYSVKAFFLDEGLKILKSMSLKKEFYKQPLSSFFSQNYLVSSDDDRLHNFVIPENTGGTYRSNHSIVLYKHKDHCVWYGDDLDHSEHDFHNDGYYAIISKETEVGLKYLMLGAVRGCNMCFDEHASLFHFTDSMITRDFHISYPTDGYSGDGFHFSTEHDTIFAVEVSFYNDYDCGCELDDEMSDKWDAKVHSKCKYQYIFNGSSYRLSKKEVEYIYED